MSRMGGRPRLRVLCLFLALSVSLTLAYGTDTKYSKYNLPVSFPSEAAERGGVPPGEDEDEAESDEPECGATVGGHRFDLGNLMRVRNYKLHDDSGNEYYINVCQNTKTVPKQCKELVEAGVHSPAYQVTPNGQCFWLGILGEQEGQYMPTWQLIDKNNPALGVEVYYWDGAECAGSKELRHIRYQFFCDQHSASSVTNFKVQQGVCRYTVVWPTKYGCPMDDYVGQQAESEDGGSSGEDDEISSGWVFVLIFCTIVIMYFGFGCGYNHINGGLALGWDAMPNTAFWFSVYEYVQEGIAFARGYLSVNSGGTTRAGYEPVSGAVEVRWDSPAS